MYYHQQGDVLIKKVTELPEGLTKLNTKVLQESEITGHHHHFEKDAAVTVYSKQALTGQQTITPNEQKYLVVDDTVYLYHGKEFDPQPAKHGRGDHDSIKIEPGVYEVDIVREYNYDKHEVRRVVD